MEKPKSGKGFLNRLFANRKFTIPLSIILAVVFWMVITLSENPQREVTISGLPVTIATANTVVEKLGLDVVGKLDTSVSVVVSGPTYIVSTLSASDLYVTANLSAVNAAGTYEIPLTANKVGTITGYDVLSVVPGKISLTFDYINEEEFPVEAVANGASAVEGLIADTPVVTNSEDSTITVHGPRSYIERIAAIRAVADVNEILSKTKSYDAKIVAVDSDGNVMDDSLFTFSSTTVKISVPIYKQKTVKVLPTFINAPAGFAETPISYTLSEAEVDVMGAPETIDELNEIRLAPINFYEISNTKNSFDVALSLPNGVRLMDNIEAITVKINVSDYMLRVFDITDCRAVNVEGNLSAGKIPQIRNVKIFGPKAVMRKLKPTDLYAEVDLTGRKAGQYTVPVTVKSSASDKLWQVGDYTTVVVIAE